MISWKPRRFPSSPAADSSVIPKLPLLTPSTACRILENRTGVNIGRSTFYRWVDNGKVFSVRVGAKIYVPWPEVERLIQQCQKGMRP